MNKKSNEEFQKKLLSIFKSEAEEHLKAITSGLIELGKALPVEKRSEIVENIFRETHSLKGAARSVSMADVQSICQPMEGVFSALKHGELDLYPELLDILHKAADTLNQIIFSYVTGKPVGPDRVVQVAEQLAKIASGEPARETKGEGGQVGVKAPSDDKEFSAAGQTTYPEEVLRISSEKMMGLLLHVEEAVSAKLAGARQAEDIGNIHTLFSEWGREYQKRYPLISDLRRSQEKKNGSGGKNAHTQQIARLLEFADWTHAQMKFLEGKLAELKRQADQDQFSVGVTIDSLLEDVKRTLMLPFSTLFEAYPKFAHDLSRENGKEIELIVSGGEIEADRRVLEELRIPFTHLIRNSIDHGVEKPEIRLKNGKQRVGMINIAVSRVEGNKVEIVLTDDGRGVDIQKIKEASARLGIVSAIEDERLTEKEVLPLIFQSGISTSSIITDISGRGLGLAIAKEKVEKLGGYILVESAYGSGVSFTIVVPVTVSAFRGVLVKAADQVFLIPTAGVACVVRIKRDDIKTIGNRDTISLEGMTVPVHSLSRILELHDTEPDRVFARIVVLEALGKRIGFAVQEVLGEEEVLMKRIGLTLTRVRNVAGGAILGTGKVAPVLNVSDLINSAMKSTGLPVADSPKVPAVEAKKTVLVVEDSITSRMLIKNILETSGYNVRTAVDGIDAMVRLRTEKFDLVVSDVDMPRMNGFDLTAKIRSDKKFFDLPVVLVTALESAADREHGIDVGANAYIAKSSFDQSNLLEVVKRLV